MDQDRSGVDHRIYELAVGQHGVCTHQQLRGQGVTEESVARRVAQGQLERLGRHCVLVDLLRDDLSQLTAGLLTVPGSAIGLFSAGRMLDFGVSARHRHLLVPHGSNREVAGVKVHETRYLPSSDVVVLDGLRVTTPARTLCDLAAWVSDRRLMHLVETQLIARRPSQEELVGCFLGFARRGRRGVGRMRLVLDATLDDQTMPMSRLELLVAEGLRSRGAPRVVRQFLPPWYDGVRGVVDFAEPEGRTIIEADSRAWHSATQAREDDARRDRLAAKHGWMVLRVGWQEVTTRPDQTFTEIISILRARQTQTSSPS